MKIITSTIKFTMKIIIFKNTKNKYENNQTIK